MVSSQYICIFWPTLIDDARGLIVEGGGEYHIRLKDHTGVRIGAFGRHSVRPLGPILLHRLPLDDSRHISKLFLQVWRVCILRRQISTKEVIRLKCEPAG